MAEWYASLRVAEKIFFYTGCIASVLLIVQIILLLISFGGAGDGDFDGDVDTDGGLSFFTVKGFTAFFALGGWCGFAAATYMENDWAPILIAVATGTLALLGVGYAMRGVAKLQCSGNIVKEKFAGLTATVYASVPPKRSGRGKITLTAQGKYMEIDAMTDCAERIPVDTSVTILEYQEDYALVAASAEGTEKTDTEA